MDLANVVRYYIEKMLKDVRGMKVLLLDADTTRIVSLVYSQTEILDQEVYLVEKLDSDRTERLEHLKAVCFLRPTRDNIASLRRELRKPHFGEYSLFFTNRVEDIRLQDLAEVDSHERVVQVQEFFGDFAVLDPHHFAVQLPKPAAALQPLSSSYNDSTEALARMTEGLASLILSLRRRFTLRYQRGSELCQKLARSLQQLTTEEERGLFDFGARHGEAAPLVLMLDRKDDPVTPLLLQWTFQAMVHELLGLQDNRVDLHSAPGVKDDFKEVVLSARQDDFFRRNQHSNFGDLGTAIKGLVDVFEGHSKSSKNIQSVADMLNFVENFSEFSAAQRNAGKHVTLMSEMSRLVDQRSLMQVSSAEQEVSCSGSSMQGHFDAIAELINSNSISNADRLRLTALFALRYENKGTAAINALLQRLRSLGIPNEMLDVVPTLLRHCGSACRVGDLYSDRSFATRFATRAKANLRGVQNVYTQHTPLLMQTLEALAKGKLPEADYPHIANAPGPGQPPAKPPKLAVIFVVGGTTYEEARVVAELNAQAERGEGWSQGIRFVLGGTGVHNSRTFLADLMLMAEAERNTGNSFV